MGVFIKTLVLCGCFLASALTFTSTCFSQTELGSEDDLTVLGTNGTALDPDTEIKGFTVFGATQPAYTGSVAGPGNVVVNGVLAVSSGAYFVGNSTFTNASKIFVNDGATGQILSKNTGGWLEWIYSSAIGDDLGDHIATTTLNMAGWSVVNVSSVNFRSNVFLTSAAAANYGGVYVSTHVFSSGNIYATKLYGDGSGLSGVGDNLGTHVATQTLSMAGFSIVNASSINYMSNVYLASATQAQLGGIYVSSNVYIVGVSSAAKYYGDGSSLTGISGDNLGNHTATKNLDMATFQLSGTGALTMSSVTATGIGLSAAQLRLASSSGVSISSEASITLGAGVRISTNVYIVGFSSAAKYYGDGSSLSGVASEVALGEKIGGSGTADWVAKFQGSGNAVTNSSIYDNGTVTVLTNPSSVTVYGKDAASGYSLVLSSGISMPSGTVNAGLLRFDSSNNIAISSESSAALGGGVRISTNVYMMGFSSATKYYGDGSALTGLAVGDSLGTHVATQTVNMANWSLVNVSSVNFRSNVFLTSATAAQGGGVYASSHVYFATGADLYNLDGISGGGALTMSSVTATGVGLVAAQLRLNSAGNIVVSSEASPTLGGGVRISTNVYIVGFSSATKYYGDGSALTGLTGLADDLGDHTATKSLDMAAFNMVNVSSVNFRSNVFLTSAAAANYGGVYVSSHVYFATGADLYNLDGISGTGALTMSSVTATGIGLSAAQLRLATASGVSISSESSAALGGGVRISTNVYIVGFSSAAKYYGDGSALTGLAVGDSLGTHVATQTLNMASFNIVNVSSVNFLSNVYIASAAPAQYGGVYVSTHIYLATGSDINNVDSISGGATSALTMSSVTATGIGLSAAQLRLATASGVSISSESSAALGGGVRISTNVYIVGFSSAAKYYGDGSALTGLAAMADNLGNHTATKNLDMANFGMVNVASITATNFIRTSTLTVIAPTSLASSLWVSTSATTPHLYVSTSGDVGIGTAAMPLTGKLTINLSASPVAAIMIDQDAANNLYNTVSFSRNGTTKGDFGLYAQNGTVMPANSMYMTTNDGSWHDVFAAKNDGTAIIMGNPTNAASLKVGIGTLNPQGRLHVLSNSITDPYTFVTSHTVTGFGIVVSTTGLVGIGMTNPTQLLHLKEKTAGLHPNIVIEDSKGDLAAIGYNTTGNYGALNSRANGISYSDSLIWKNGNVAIGTTTPSYRLVVSSGAGEAGTILAVSTGTSTMIELQGDGDVIAKRFVGDGSQLTNLTGAADDLGDHVATTTLNMANFGMVNVASITVTNFIKTSTLTVIAPTSLPSSLWVSTSATAPHLYVSTMGNVGIGTPGPLGKLAVIGDITGTTPNILTGTPGAAQGEKSGISFSSTFQGTGDNGPRRTADILAGFNGGSWANEYLAFNVGNNGAANDGRVLTSEKMRIQGNGYVGIGTTPGYTLDVNGQMRAERYRGINSLVLNDYQTVNPASNVYLHSPANTRDSWIFRDDDVTSNWGIYHRQIDSTVKNLPGNSIGFIGGGSSNLLSYISLGDGSAYFAGNVGIGTVTPQGQFHINSSGAHEIRFSNTGMTSTNKDFRIIQDAAGAATRIANVGDTIKYMSFIMDNGFVGIGTDNPSARLEMAHADNNAIKINRSVNTLYSGLTFADAGTEKWTIGQTPNSNTFSFRKNGSVSGDVVIGTSGNVGIGTTTPNYRLHVSSGAGETGTVMAVSTGATNLFWVAGDGAHAVKFFGDGSGLTNLTGAGDNLGNHTATQALDMNNKAVDNVSSVTITGTGVTGSAPLFKVAGSTMVVLNNGNVGIGTSAPESTLHIKDVDTTGPALYIEGASATEGDIAWPSNETLQLGRWDPASDTFTEAMRIDSIGNVGVGTTGPGAKLEVQQTDTAQAYSVKIGTSSTAYHVVVSTGGNIGIGTTPHDAHIHEVSSSIDNLFLEEAMPGRAAQISLKNPSKYSVNPSLPG